nr:hypothetical protein [Tanacetum cinerariifolium]
MAFLSAVASRFLPLNNQLRTSSNPRNQATIQDGRVTVQQVQRRQPQSFAGTRNKGVAITSRGNYAASQPRVMKCYNYQREGYMARQCTQPQRPRNSAWFKEKLMLFEAQEAGQTKDLDAYDLDCDYISSAKAVLTVNFSSCDSDVLSETNKMVNESLTAELERYKERVVIFKQRQNLDLKKREKLIDSQMDDLIRNRNAKLATFQQEIDTLKETLSNNVKEKDSLSTTLNVFKTEFKEKESKARPTDHLCLFPGNHLMKKGITMVEPNLIEYISVTRKNYFSDDKEGRMVEKSFLEIQGTFLVKLRDIVFNGIIGESAFEHIENFLEIVGPLKIKDNYGINDTDNTQDDQGLREQHTTHDLSVCRARLAILTFLIGGCDGAHDLRAEIDDYEVVSDQGPRYDWDAPRRIKCSPHPCK